MTQFAFWGVVLACVLCTGCGTNSVTDGTGNGQSGLAIAVVGGDEGVTIAEDADGNARFLGEIKNSGTATGCFINVVIDALDADGNPLASGSSSAFDFLFGESFQFAQFFGFGAVTYHHCLSAGATGSFDLQTTIPIANVASVVAHPSCQGDEAAACLPQDGGAYFRPLPLLSLNGAITETTDASGHRMYTGTIINNRPLNEVSSKATDIRIVFTAKNASGRVVDVACLDRDGKTCFPMSFSSTAMGPQETWDFAVSLSIEPSQTCSACFSYQLNYAT